MTQSPHSVRIYIVGAGVISRAHAAAAEKLGVPADLHVTDPSPQAIAAFTAEFPKAKVWPSLVEMLADPAREDDVVIVATPPFTHCPLASIALKRGRHVLCEKPLAMNLDEARQMLAIARDHGRQFGCCSSRFLGLRAAAKVRELMTSAALGDPYHLTFIQRQNRGRTGIEYQPGSTWFLDKSKNGGGVLMDWGPYDFSSMAELFRPTCVEVTSAWLCSPSTDLKLPEGAIFNTEQYVSAQLRYTLDTGQVVNVTYERAACTHGRKAAINELEGTRGSATWDWLGSSGKDACWSYDRAGKIAMEKFDLPETDAVDPHHRPLRYFLAGIRGEPTAGVHDAQAVFNFACLRAVYDAAETRTPRIVRLGDFQ